MLDYAGVTPLGQSQRHAWAPVGLFGACHGLYFQSLAVRSSVTIGNRPTLEGL
jgi:hypothetical protein